jgi:uncharacterized protein
MRDRPALLLFARAPVPGETKTRLIPALGAERAAALYRCFLLDALAEARRQAADVIVAAAEPAHRPAVDTLVEEACPGAEVVVQSGRDLGERMLNAFRQALRAGYRSGVILGTDVPGLPGHCVAEALALASKQDVVLGPCPDGGYYAVGMHAVIPGLFESLTWGTPTVLAETLARARALDLNVTLLEPWPDVDTPEDLAGLRRRLAAIAAAGEEVPCPQTWQWLRAHPEAAG